MPPPDSAHERRALLLSIVASALLGALGVVWGVVSGSQMILLDGAYAVIGIALSALLMRASRLARVGPTGRYHYGQQAATPLVIGLQGLVLLGTLLFAALEAVATIRDGGSEVTPGWAVLYSVIVTVGSVVFWVWLRRRTEGSDLLTSEATAWGVAALRGVGMGVGFAVMWALVDSAWDGAVPYVDPVMVLVTCVAFLPAPLAMVRATLNELLERAPRSDVQAPVHEAVAEVCRRFGLGTPDVRIAKVGPKLYVEVEAPADGRTTIAAEHEARTALRARLTGLPYEIWLTFELTPAAPD